MRGDILGCLSSFGYVSCLGIDISNVLVEITYLLINLASRYVVAVDLNLSTRLEHRVRR